MFQFIFSERGGGVAYIVEKDGKSHVVHNGNAGKPYQAVGSVVLSPDGKRIAYGALVDGKWRMVIDGKEGSPFNTVKSPLFSLDGSHLAYQAMAGERWHLVVDTTPNAGTQSRYLTHEFSADSSRIAFIDNVDDKSRGRLVVSDPAFTKQTIIASGVSLMLSNTDKSRIAAISTIENKQSVIDFSFDRPDSVKKGTLYDAASALAFGPDGVTPAYTAERAGKRLLIIDDREAALPDGIISGSPVIHPDKKMSTALISSNNTVFLQQLYPVGGGREIGYEAAEGLVYSRDGSFHAYAAQKGESWFVVVNGKEGPAFDRVVSPKFSPDGKFLVYRARKAGKRFVVVADTTGKSIRTHPAYEQVFDAVFTADGKSVAYGVKDGQKLIWKVEAL
jgi:WD40 repeat protein